MPLKISDPRTCYACDKRRNGLNEEMNVVIVCMSVAAAGDVVLLLLGRSFFPRTHFRIDQTDRDEITITVVNTLTTEQIAQIRADLAAIAGVIIQ